MPEKAYLPPEIDKYYEKWKRDPHSRIFAQLADAYRKNGMLDEAIEVCLEGLKVHPSYNSARMVLARAYQEKGLDTEAGNELTEIVKNDPDNMLAHRMLADQSYKEGRLEEAIEQYHKVLSLTPLDREVRTILEKAEANLAEISTPPEIGESESDRTQEEESRWEIPGSSLEMEKPGLEGTGEKESEAAPSEATETEEREDAFLTETIADLYLKQGLREKAMEIFSKMLTADPGNSHIQERLREATQLREESSTGEGQIDLEPEIEGPTVPVIVIPESVDIDEEPSLDVLEPEVVSAPSDEGVEEGIAGELPLPVLEFGTLEDVPSTGSLPADSVLIESGEGTTGATVQDPPGLVMETGMPEAVDSDSLHLPGGERASEILSRWLEGIEKGRRSGR